MFTYIELMTYFIQKRFNAPKQKRNFERKLLSSSRIFIKDDSRLAGQEIPRHS
jgi:hypothetical protein